MKMDILKWKFKTKIAILTPKLQFDVKIIDQTQISTIQDHSKLIYLSHNSLFLSLRSSQNINICTGPPCTVSTYSDEKYENSKNPKQAQACGLARRFMQIVKKIRKM